MDTEEIKEKLKSRLKPKRYEHTLGVSDTAKDMAKRFGADPDKAYLAGLLHDCAKNIEIDEQIELCREYGIALDDITLKCPAVIHAPLGAEVARREYGVEDKYILNAIAYHTVGRAGMSDLEKIIYIADMIEPTRSFDGVDELRGLAMNDLNKAAIAAVQRTMIFNLLKGNLIHPNTLEMWNDII